MSNVFISILDEVGTIGKDIFKELPAVVDLAKDAEPFIAIAFPSISPLWNEAVTLIQTWEAAAAAAGAVKAGKMKKVMVVAGLTPFAATHATAMGIVTPSTKQLGDYVDHVVAEQKLFQALGVTKVA